MGAPALHPAGSRPSALSQTEKAGRLQCGLTPRSLAVEAALRGPSRESVLGRQKGSRFRHTGRMSHRFHGHEWGGQALRIARLCAAWTPTPVGVYVHGSAALGGFGPASDLDVLVVTDGGSNWPALGAQLLAECGGPRTLELSVVAADAARRPSRPWPFFLHVNSEDERVDLDEGRGDPDLICHYAVTRTAGVTVSGPPPESAFGPVSRSQLVDYFREELRWSLTHADQRYAVLNACRAMAYADRGVLLSKPAGGQWWLQQFGAEALVDQALAAQEEGRDLGPSSPEARSFVGAAVAAL